MRDTSKKLALPVLAAASAALSAAGFSSLAKADFTFTYTAAFFGSNTVYDLFAKTDGLNSTGTTIADMDVTITTIGGAMVINQNTDFDGDGVPDADIFGCTSGNLTAVAFGNTLGTFARLKGMTLALVNAQGKGEAAPVTEFQVGSAYPTFPEGYQTAPGGSTVQAVNARYSSLVSLEIVGVSGGTTANAGSGGAFLNLVLPYNVGCRVTAVVAGTGGNTFTDTFILSGPEPAPENLVTLTSSAPTNMGSAIAGLTVTGGNGKYNPAFASANSLSGYSKVSGFSPGTDTEIFLIKFSSNAEDTQVIQDIDSGGPPFSFAAQAPDASVATLGGIAWDVELIARSTGVPNGYFGFDFTDVSGITVTEIAAVPEPAAVGVLPFSGVALLARRRRQRMHGYFQ